MTTATFVSTVSRRHRIQVDFVLDHRRNPVDMVGSAHEFGSPEFDAQMAAYRADQENSVKTQWPDLVSEDTTRDAASISFVETGPAQWDHAWTHTIACPVRLFTEVDTELDPESEEALALFQAAADTAAQAWIDGKGLTPV